MKYSLVVLCACFMFAQVYADTVPIQGGSDQVKKAFESMMKAIDSALTSAQAALNKAMDSVNTEATKITDKAKNEIAGLTGDLQKKLDEYVQEAAVLGLDVTDCETYVDQFAAIPNNTVDGIIGCITTQVAKAKGYCDDALVNCKQIESDLANMESEIDNCSGNALKKAKCYAKILKDIVEATGTGPQHIVEDVTKASVLVSQLVPILEQCEIDQVKNVGTTAATLVGQFAICAGVPTY